MFSDFGDSQSCDLIRRCTVMKLSFAVDQIAIRLSTLSRGLPGLYFDPADRRF